MICAAAANFAERSGTACQQYNQQDDARTDAQDDERDPIHDLTR